MSKEEEDVREIADQIYKIASSHRGWSMCIDIVRNCVNHLHANAKLMELRRETESKRED